HMNVNGRQEDAHLLPIAWWRRVGQRRSGDEHPTVSGGDNGVDSHTGVPLWIAKKEQEESSPHAERQRSKPAESDAAERRKREGAADERPTRRVDRESGHLRRGQRRSTRNVGSDSNVLRTPSVTKSYFVWQGSVMLRLLTAAAHDVFHAVLQLQLSLL